MKNKYDAFEQEIEYLMNGVERDEPFTRLDAIRQIGEDCEEYEPKIRKAVRQYLISCGVYAEVKPEDLPHIIVMGGRKYDFKIDGKMYAFTHWKNLK